MTIAQAFNEITVAQGGTPNYSGTISGAIDALNDALAGSDQPAAQTIEGAVRLLGQHIGGSASGTIEITENGEGIDVAQYAYADVNVSGGSQSGYIYVYEYSEVEVPQEKPWGKVYVGETEVPSTTTLTIADNDGNPATALGYEVPLGSVARYVPNLTGYDYAKFDDYVFASPEDAADLEGDFLVYSVNNESSYGGVGAVPTPASTPSVCFIEYNNIS